MRIVWLRSCADNIVAMPAEIPRVYAVHGGQRMPQPCAHVVVRAAHVEPLEQQPCIIAVRAAALDSGDPYVLRAREFLQPIGFRRKVLQEVGTVQFDKPGAAITVFGTKTLINISARYTHPAAGGHVDTGPGFDVSRNICRS